MNNTIVVEEAEILNNNTLSFNLSYPNRTKEYFKSDNIVFQYDKEIASVDPSILQIPAVATIIALAWALGSDVYVKTLDRTYLEALNKVKSVMKVWYPWFSFSTKINVDSIVTNRLHNNGYGVLFTGGIDSTTSYLRHKGKKPHLIAVWGTKRYVEPRIETVEKRLTDFANKEGVKIHFVTTNFEKAINFDLLDENYGLEWWIHVFHSTVLTGISAPLTGVENISTLLIASSNTKKYNIPYGSHLYIDNKLKWADVQVVHDGSELTRQEKIRYVLKDHILKSGDYPFIRSCVCASGNNCGKCEKCFRTIAGLVLENINPNQCGFNNVNAETFNLIKENVIKNLPQIQMNFVRTPFHKGGPKEALRTAIDGFSLEDFDDVGQVSSTISRLTRIMNWTDIQEHIPEKLNHNLLGSKPFYDWFRTFDHRNAKKTEAMRFHLFGVLTYAYYHSPKNFRRSIKRSFLFSIYHRLIK